jgi:hypothetical protein
MSRQKKLLVVVGDAGALQNQLAEDFVPGLVDFLQLCQREEWCCHAEALDYGKPNPFSGIIGRPRNLCLASACVSRDLAQGLQRWRWLERI